jgi:hypothetical protein
MSAFGQKRTFGIVQPMSALPPKVDMASTVERLGGCRKKIRPLKWRPFEFVTGTKRPPPVKNRSDSKLHFDIGNNFDLAQNCRARRPYQSKSLTQKVILGHHRKFAMDFLLYP